MPLSPLARFRRRFLAMAPVRFAEFFRATAEEDTSEADIETAHVIVEFANGKYWPMIRAYLESEIAKPIPMGDQMTMVGAAVRSNTLKEIRAKMERDIAASVAILDEAQKT